MKLNKKLWIILAIVVLAIIAVVLLKPKVAKAEEAVAKTGITVEGYTDVVLERELVSMGQDVDIEGSWTGLKVNIPVVKDVTIIPMIAVVDGSFEAKNTGMGEVECDASVGYGLGAKIEKVIKGITVALLGDVRATNLGVDKINGSPAFTNMDVDYFEWETELQFSKPIAVLNSVLTPIFGVRYSDVRAKMNARIYEDLGIGIKSEAKDNIGITLGADYKLNDVWSAGIRTKLIDQEAITGAVSYKF